MLKYIIGLSLFGMALITVPVRSQPRITTTVNTGTAYASAKCRADWKSWTSLCCSTYGSRSDCEEAEKKPCVAFDPDADAERTKNSRVAPAC